MSTDWKVKSLGQITRLEYGRALKDDDRNHEGNIPVFGSDGRVGWHNESLSSGRGIIIGRKGNAGAINFSNSPFFCIDTTFYISDSDEFDLKYLYFALKHSNIKDLTSDSAVPGLNRDAAYSVELIRKIRVRVPPSELPHSDHAAD